MHFWDFSNEAFQPELWGFSNNTVFQLRCLEKFIYLVAFVSYYKYVKWSRPWNERNQISTDFVISVNIVSLSNEPIKYCRKYNTSDLHPEWIRGGKAIFFCAFTWPESQPCRWSYPSRWNSWRRSVWAGWSKRWADATAAAAWRPRGAAGTLDSTWIKRSAQRL